jgi:dipeptidase
LIKKHGQGGRCGYDKTGFSYHNSFLVADSGGAWVIEAAGSRIAARRVDAGVYAISNSITLEELSPLEERIRPRVAMATHRRQRTQCLALAAADAQHAMDVLRDHGEGRVRPHYSRLNGAMSAPCMHAGGWLAASQTVGSFVAELGASGQRYWATGTAAPCLSVFRPVSIGRPHDVGAPTGMQDASLWWRFEALHRALLAADSTTVSEYLSDRDRIQALVLGSDEAAAWQSADAWLSDWRQRLAVPPANDSRPSWLRRYWHNVAKQASCGSRLPWRPA